MGDALTGVRPVKLPTRALAAGATPAQAEGMLRDQYHVSPLRRHAGRVTCAQASRGVQASLAPQEISLYVGIPFCPTRCAYCSFVSAAGSAKPELIAPVPGGPAHGDRRRRGQPPARRG